MAGAGLAPDNETRDYQNHSAASNIGGHGEMVEEQVKLMSENRSPRPSAESRRRAAIDTIDFAAVKAGIRSSAGTTANGSL